ncbi:MAG: hypothetical protein ACRCZQ_02715 [Bacteroidales bacterium]
MKLFVTYLANSILSIGVFFLLSGCSADSSSGQTEQTEPVVLEFSLNQISESKSDVTSLFAQCGTDLDLDQRLPYSFVIRVLQKERNIEKEIKGVLGKFDDKLKSDPVFLPVGTYTLLDAKIMKSGPVLYQAVMPGSELSPFVPVGSLLGNTFSVLSFTKPTISTYMVCTTNYVAAQFGMPKFETQRVESYCFDLFVNVCNPALDNEHFVGKGTVKVYSKEGGNLLWEDKDGFDEGKIATICFADYLDDPNDSYYIEVIVNNSFLSQPIKYAGVVPVAELLKFRSLPQWDVSMNALHIQLCPEKDNCFFGKYICKVVGEN